MNREDGKSNLIKDLSDSQALDVELSSKDLPPAPLLQERLRGIGEALKPAGASYEGSTCAHYYVSTLSREAFVIHQTTGLENVPAQLASFGLSDHSLKLRQQYDPKFKQKTKNKLDKR